MGKVQLTAEIDEELSTRVKLAAASSEQSVSEWVEELLMRELGGRREFRLDDATINMPPLGSKPRGSENPPRLRGKGGTASDAVIEDRR